MEGTIKTFDPILKFGYICYESDKSIFANVRNFVDRLSDDELAHLAGKTVTFEIGSFTNKMGIARPTAVQIRIKQELKLPEAEASTDDLMPYDEQKKAERKAKRERCDGYAECYVGKKTDRKAKAERRRKVERALAKAEAEDGEGEGW